MKTDKKLDRVPFKDDGSYVDDYSMDYLDDDASTVDLAQSSMDGTSKQHTLGELTKHPNDRRLKSERIALYTFVGFIFAMFIGLIPLSWKDRTQTYVGDSLRPLGDENMITCAGREGKITLDEWLDQDRQDITTICDPIFLGESVKANAARTPVKVFIMMGEANMVGSGQINGDFEGTLSYTVKEKGRFTHLLQSDGAWSSRDDVRHVAVHSDFEVSENGWLRVPSEREYFGPELQFGYVMGELYDEPVLLIKSASGHNSLGGDILPPGSQQYELDGYVYAGYGETPRRWPVGTTPTANSWQAGSKYDEYVANVKRVLMNIGDYYPGASTYEILGFVWWQGDSDRRVPAYTSTYEGNLVRLINGLRFDFRAPHAKVVVATLGQEGSEMAGSTLEIVQDQLRVSEYEFYPQHSGNVASVDTRPSWRGAFLPGHDGDHSYMDAAHYGNQAETIMEVGNAVGLAMAQLLLE